MATTISADGTTIRHTRGDTLALPIYLKHADGTDYAPAEGDAVRFVMRPEGLNPKGTAYKYPVCLRKSIDTAAMELALDPADTAALPFGKYIYDIEVATAGGDVYTPIAGAVMILTPEVD